MHRRFEACLTQGAVEEELRARIPHQAVSRQVEIGAAGAAAAAGAAGGNTGTPNRRIDVPVVSDDAEGSELLDHNRTSPSLELATLADPRSGDA